MEISVSQRLQTLRQFMLQKGLQAFIIPTTDAHASEYTPTHFECRKWISGFKGSAGTAVVTMNKAALWTDSRYFLAAAEELEGTEFILMKDGLPSTPSITEWICNELKQNNVVGLDGWVNTALEVQSLQKELAAKGIQLNTEFDPFNIIWKDRPSYPTNTIQIHPLEYAGEGCSSKIERLRTKLADQGTEAMLVSDLDEVAWLLNLRGSDVHCTPVFVAFCLVTMQRVVLFIDSKKITPEVLSYLLQEGIEIQEYQHIKQEIESLSNLHIFLPSTINASLYTAAKHLNITLGLSPIAGMKAIKNEVEIQGFQGAMERDGVALVKFLRWLLPAVQKGGETELSVSNKLLQLRQEQALFCDISFDTISAYAAHGAIVHYEPTHETDVPLQPNGLLLIDSGAQYLDGTTDITRTIALGTPTEEEKHVYTLVLKGHIALSKCVFPTGASGTQLDLAARYAMWQEGYNYGHGTGHGVGSYLSVHEGPHQIRMNYKPAPISAGVIVTDEPGLYLANRFGVRTENMLLCIPSKKTEFGEFVQFEPLTLCPIDTKPIDFSMLTNEEISWLNNYHKEVYQRLLPLLNDTEDIKWLTEATKPITK